ncbi:MAG: hypothetical protein ACXVB2_12530 [Isosphaeraceae bacterium]
MVSIRSQDSCLQENRIVPENGVLCQDVDKNQHLASTRRTRKAKDSKPPAKTKLTVYVDEDTAKRFSVHATYLGHDKSSLFAELVKSNCNRFVVSDRKPDALPNRQGEAQS